MLLSDHHTNSFKSDNWCHSISKWISFTYFRHLKTCQPECVTHCVDICYFISKSSSFWLFPIWSTSLSPPLTISPVLPLSVSHSRQAWLLCPEWHHRHKPVTGKTGGMHSERGIETMREREPVEWENVKENRKSRERERKNSIDSAGHEWSSQKTPLTNTHLPPPSLTASLSSIRLSPPFLFVLLSLISFRGIRQQQHPPRNPEGGSFYTSLSVTQLKRTWLDKSIAFLF